MGFMFRLFRRNGLFLDDASILLSGCLKGQIEALSKKIRQTAGLT